MEPADARLLLEGVSVARDALASYRRAYVRGQWDAAPMPLAHMKAISLLRSNEDQVLIWNVFAQRESLCFCGDVLKLLTGLVPYPIPAAITATPAEFYLEPDAEPRNMSVHVHTGAHDNFCVNLPVHLRRAELNTDWSEVPEFMGRTPCGEFTRMIDQLCLGSESLAVRDAFPPPFVYAIEKMPMAALGHLYCYFPTSLAVRILQDWALIMRSALSRGLPHHILTAMQQNGGTKVHVPRGDLRVAYEQATLEWLTHRYGRERLASHR